MSHFPLPRHTAPALKLDLLSGESYDLHAQQPAQFSMLVFYRGLHCPVCKTYLETLKDVQEKYAAQGVEVIAISMDSAARARKSRMDWNIEGLPLGYQMDRATAEAWGLYLSKGIKDKEPELFSEPGLFLVRPDGTLYYAAINSAPWGRPHLPSFLKVIQFIVENGYPARGEVAPHTAV